MQLEIEITTKDGVYQEVTPTIISKLERIVKVGTRLYIFYDGKREVFGDKKVDIKIKE